MNWAAVARFVTKNLPAVAAIVMAVRDIIRKPKRPKKEGNQNGDR